MDYGNGFYTEGPLTEKLYGFSKKSLFIEILDPRPNLHKVLLSIDKNYMPVEKNIFKLDSTLLPDLDDDMDVSFCSDSSQDLFNMPHPDTKVLEQFRQSIMEKTGPVRCFKALTGKQAAYLAAAWPEEKCVVTPDDFDTFIQDISDVPFTVPGKPEVRNKVRFITFS